MPPPSTPHPPPGSGRRSTVVALVLVLSVLTGAAPARTDGPLRLAVGLFSAAAPGDPLPEDWQPLTFKGIERHTRYALVADEGRTVVAADSRSAASGIIRRIAIDPQRYPILTWRWKVSGTLTKGDAARKAGDDYPARLYITFAADPRHLSAIERLRNQAARLLYGEAPPSAALTYIWANRTAKEAIVPNPYTARVQMVAVQSGAALSGRWVEERRDLYADYVKAFGQAPPPISGVALMTDTDNTGEAVQAWYGDILFEARQP